MSDFPCPFPSCERSLNTERGRKQHHTKVHDEPLPNCTCKGCGTDFYHPKSSRSFCEDCNPNKGENNPNYKNAKEETTCNECGSKFEYYPSNKKGLYCSNCQREKVNEENLSEFTSEGMKGENNPQWSGGLHTVECFYCGGDAEKLKNELENHERHFCSTNCQLDWYSEEMDGEHSEITIPDINKSSKTWHIVRNEVLKRDNYTCQMCEVENGFNHVHHMIPRTEFEDEEDAHYEKNCLTLCISCHGSVESGGKDIPDSVIKEKDLEEPPYDKYSNR